MMNADANRLMKISIMALIGEGELEAAETLRTLETEDVPGLKEKLRLLELSPNKALSWEAKYLRISL